MGDEEVKSEVQEMNESFGFESADETKIDEPAKEEVKEDEPKEDEETEEEGKEKASKEEVGEVGKGEEIPPGEEEVPPEEPEEGTLDEKEIIEKKEPEPDEKDKTIAELRKRLDEKEVKEEPEPEPEPKPEEPLKFESQDFIDKDEDLEDLIRDPGKLNEVFNKVYQRAVTDTRKVLGEGVLRSIPDIVRASVDMMDKLKQMYTKFYTDNEDLKPFKKVVAAVFEEVATDNPGKDMMDLLPMVADDARKRLELHKQATQTTDTKPPRLHTRKRRTALLEDKPNPDPLLNELDEMNSSIRR